MMKNKILVILLIILLILSGCASTYPKGNSLGLNKVSNLNNEQAQAVNSPIVNEPRRDESIEIDSCQVIDEEGEYKLVNDIESTRDEVCINIQADNINLDCQRHIIDGNLEEVPEDEERIGIYVLGTEDDNLTNLTIKNCDINGWYKGIYFENVDNSKIINNIIVTTIEDSYKLEYPNNKFNLNDTAYDIDNKLTKTQLPTLLEKDTFLDDKGANRGNTEYIQELLFTNRGNSVSEKTIWYIYDQDSGDSDKPMGDYIYLSRYTNTNIWTYNFDLDSSVAVSNSADLENTRLNLLGRDFIINGVDITADKVSKLILVTGADEFILENGEEVKVNDAEISGSKVTFGSVHGFDQFNISFKPNQKVFLKPGDEYEDQVFGAFKIIFSGVIEARPEDILLSASGEKVDLTATNKDGEITTSTVAFANTTGVGDIMPGADRDEPFIALEGDFVTNTSMGESELSGMTGIRFLYSMNDRSHIVRIKNIDTLNNKTTFYDETTDTELADQEFTPEVASAFNFLPTTFQLNFSYREGSQSNAQITFIDINDKGSSYFLKNGGNITFWSNWSGSSTPGGIRGNGDIPSQSGNTPYYLTFGELDAERETNIPLNVININLTYSTTNQEINFQSVTSNANFAHRTTSLKQKDKSDTTLKAGKTVYGTYVEQLTPTGAGMDNITIKTPDTATYAEVWISSINTEGERTGIKILNSNNNFIADNNVKDNDKGINLISSSSNNLVSNTFCYNKKDIKIEENSEDNEFLYNQFDNMEGLELEGMPCEIEEHKIQLNLGWNLISSYLIPYYADIEAIFGVLARSGILLMVKDENGNFMAPANNFNNIDEWNSQEAYHIKVNKSTTLIIKGQERVNPRIELQEGWNNIAYPLNRTRNMRRDIIPNVLASLIEGGKLEMIKDVEGNFYLPRRNFNNIREMKPGQGYLIDENENTVIDFNE